jgi:hypothetical protein
MNAKNKTDRIFRLMAKAGLLLVATLLWVACDYSYKDTVSYQINEPVSMSMADFRNSVKITGEQHPISNYGKICFYNGFLFISEAETGIHIIDDRDPAKPDYVGFIELLGNADLAIRDNLLYADAYIDLVWFDVSNPVKPELKGRLEDAFPYALPVCGNGFNYDYSKVYETREVKKEIIVGWNLAQRTEEIEYRSIEDGYMMYENGYASDKSPTGTGINGSMSRFSLYNDYMYVVLNGQMFVYDLSGENPSKIDNNLYIGNVETIFNYKDKMFLGMPTGMAIYSVENPAEPTYCSSIQHVYGCDPVVVENDLAYVTVHSGNLCGQNNDELFIMDVSDVYNPKQLAAYSMKNPKGLGIDNGTLFLCDDGLKIFDAKNPQTIVANQLAHYRGMDGFDVIPYNHILMMIADNGLYQYDYSNMNNIKELSLIPINKK